MKTFCLAILFIGVLGACQKSELQLDQAVISEYKHFAERINKSFQFDLFREVVRLGRSGENQIVSPLSVSLALGMVYHGANGTTQQEIGSLLGFDDLDDEGIKAYSQALITYLQGADSKANFNLANAIFYDEKRILPHQTFLDVNSVYNQAQIQKLDFEKDNTPDRINNWVSEMTANKIEKIVESISEHDLMLLLNALYFEGGWTKRFDTNQTAKKDFHLASGGMIMVDMMFQELTCPFIQNDVHTAFDLFLGDSIFSVTFLLPNGDVDEWIAQSRQGHLEDIWLQMSIHRIKCFVPKFELSVSYSLKKALQNLGLETAFDLTADFTRLGAILSPGVTRLSRADHKTYFKVDENGVKAAAVTSLTPIIVSEPPTILMDRPFVFILRDRIANQIVFIGKVENPTEKPK